MRPRRGRRQKQPTSDSRFLFVNEDASTVTRTGKDPDLDREKQSHVQRQNFVKRKQGKDGNSHATSLQEPEVVLARSDSVVPSSVRSALFAARFPDLTLAQTPTNASELFLAPQPWLPEYELAPSSSGLSRRFADHVGHDLNLPILSSQHSPERFQQELVHASANLSLFNPLRSSQPHPLLTDTPNTSRASASILSRWAPSLMQYWTTVLIRESFFIDTRLLPLSRLRHAPAIHAEMQDAMSHPSHLYSLLAAASMQMLAREGRLLSPTASTRNGLPQNDEAEHMRIILFFKTRALESLRAHLANSVAVTHQTAADVLRLLTVAFFSDAYESAIPHHEAMQSMITSLGGLGTFSDYFVETRVMLHWAACLRRLKKPDWSVADWADPGAGDEEIRFITGLLRMHGGSPPAPGQTSADGSDDMIRQAAHASRGMAKGFAELSAVGILAPVLRQAIEDLADVLRFERYAEVHATRAIKQGGCKPEHFKWSNRRHVALGFRLLSIDKETDFGDAPTTRTSSTGGQDACVDYYTRNEAIRMALVFVVGLTRSPARGRRCGSKAVWKLREMLEAGTRRRQLDHPEQRHEESDDATEANDFEAWLATEPSPTSSPPTGTAQAFVADPALNYSDATQQSAVLDPILTLPIDPHFLPHSTDVTAAPSAPSPHLAIKRAIVTSWHPHTSVLLWIACVGAMTARSGTMDWEWFGGVAREAVTALGVKSWDELEAVLGEFVYEPAVLREGCWEVWRAVTHAAMERQGSLRE